MSLQVILEKARSVDSKAPRRPSQSRLSFAVSLLIIAVLGPGLTATSGSKARSHAARQGALTVLPSAESAGERVTPIRAGVSHRDHSSDEA
jgi:hypothetical protein